MQSAWRIVKLQHSKAAFSGEGARRFGGRWNSIGKLAIYLAEYQSTAALEVLVHHYPLMPQQKYHCFRVEWSEKLMEKVDDSRLPKNWRANPPRCESQDLGDHWLENGTAPVLSVPSAIIPSERNFILNPSHSDFKRIKIHPPKLFVFDPRLLGKVK